MDTKNKCCLMILNYNGQEYLRTCIPSALEAVQNFGFPCPVIVVDNHSTEGDVRYVQTQFPDIQIEGAEKNDYLFSFNEVLKRRSEEIVILLNNDMRFDTGFIRPLIQHFQDPDVFAVSCKTMNWENTRVMTSKRIGYFRNFWFYKRWDYETKTASLTLEFCGGSAAIRRSMFLALGGFDPLFFPGYAEDADISYRAWKRGWKIIYEPQSIVYHRVSASFEKTYSKFKLYALICRNEVLFTLKNCGNSRFFVIYLLLLPLRMLRNCLSGNVSAALGILWAFLKMPAAIKKRLNRSGSNLEEKVFIGEIRRGNLS